MRKLIAAVVATAVFLGATGGTANYVQAAVTADAVAATWLDQTQLNKGLVTVQYDVSKNVKTKLMITKGTEKYTYNLRPGVKAERFALQLGNGEYTLAVLELVGGNQYKVAQKSTVKLDLPDPKVVYLNAIQNIDWNDQSKAILKARELVKGKKTDAEKVQVIYNYIITNIGYDNTLAQNVTVDYLPQIDQTLKNGKDICYGYAALFAAMLRSEGIPTKMVMGKTTYVKEYHAWNEVFLDGKWVTIDPTVDAGLKNTKQALPMIKDKAKYTTEKQY